MSTVCIAGDGDDCGSRHFPSPAPEEDLGRVLCLPVRIPGGSHHLYTGEDDADSEHGLQAYFLQAPSADMPGLQLINEMCEAGVSLFDVDCDVF